jgi:hypothetical protein
LLGRTIGRTHSIVERLRRPIGAVRPSDRSRVEADLGE